MVLVSGLVCSFRGCLHSYWHIFVVSYDFFFVLRGLFSILYLLVAEKWRKLVEKEMWSLFQLNSCPGLNWVESFVVWCFKY